MKQPVPFKALAPINTLIHALQCKADQFRYGILLLMSFLLLISGNISAQNTCPGISAPVCGSNGVTYLNSCYAEAAGITEYTTGVCFDFCIIPQNFDDDANCGTEFNPVCGCNGVTYLNQCVAQANGISNFFFGICESDCVDPERIGNSSAINVNDEGIITVDCPGNYDPVCGCNGITYDNSCLAEAAGVITYTPGICINTCIRAVEIDPDPNCSQDYQPVCGCNDVLYPNACMAEAAGVQEYSNGYCGQGSSWCNEARILNCGDFLANETTIGAGNQIISYQNCNSFTFLGQDRVYIINKNTAGDLQIGMEILTPNLDLDIFLLEGTCNQVRCIASSTTSNTVTNNEGIIVEDAPIGTYFLVVDAQFAGAQGNYNLELSCGYLSCTDAVPVTCGTPYTGNNSNGSDNTSLYSCEGNVLNVENNGPEIVHTFTTTAAGTVEVDLSGLSANLELFLLRTCDRGSCIDYSQNSGTNSESITANLPAGTYYVVVDGFNGATSDYTLEVNCISDCAIELSDLTVSPSDCGENNGRIAATINGGDPAYLVSWTGTVSGSAFIQGDDLLITDLPTGIYTLRIVDSKGCVAQTSVTIASEGEMEIQVNAIDAVCDGTGALEINILNGTPGYRINITGTLVTNINTQDDSYTLGNLPPGAYNVFVMDDLGCSASQSVVIGQDAGDFEVVAVGNEATCDGVGSINVSTSNGSPLYTILLSGPVSGSGLSADEDFQIINLPPGVYTLTVIDDEGCSVTQVVEINTSGDLSVETEVQNGECDENGVIFININSGTPGFVVTYNGPSSGQIITDQPQVTLFNLPGGTYTITVEDALGCTTEEIATVIVGNELELTVTSVPEACGQAGFIFVEIDQGVSPFTVIWSGPSSGLAEFAAPEYLITDLPAGIYQVQVTDAAGCSRTGVYFVEQQEEVIFEATPIRGLCGQTGRINIEISSGTSPFVLSWNGPAFGSVFITGNTYSIINIPSGSYQVQIVDSFDCNSTVAVELEDPQGELMFTGEVFEDICGITSDLLIEIQSGNAPYLLSWSGPSSNTLVIDTDTYLISDLEDGLYTIEISDASGCEIEESIAVTNTIPAFQAGAFVAVGLCGQNGTVQLNFSNGEAPYTVTWSGPVDGQTTVSANAYEIEDLPSGNYDIRVEDDNGCVDEINLTLQNQEDNLEVTASTAVAPCGELGGFNFQVTEGTPPYQMSWSGADTGSGVFFSNNFSITGLQSGTYFFSLSDINGCEDNTFGTLNNVENNIVISANPLNGACGADATVLIEIDGGTPSYEIEWNGPLPGIIFTDQESFTISMLEGGLYEFIITDALGCMDTTNVVVGDSNGVLDVETQVNNNLCGPLGSIDLEFLEGETPFTIVWDGPLSGQATVADDEFSLQDLLSGAYTIEVTDATGCDNTLELQLINADSEPDINTEALIGNCGVSGQIVVNISDNNPNYTIDWQGPASGSATSTSSTYIIQDLIPGQYGISVTNNNGCVTATSALMAEGSPEVNLIVETNPGACGEFGSIDLTVEGGEGDFDLSWSGPSSGNETISGNTFSLTNLMGGDYSFQLSDANNCTDNQLANLENSSEPISFTLEPVDGICQEFGSIQLQIDSGTAPYEISWAGPASGSDDTSEDNFEISNLLAGTYTVTVRDALDCENEMTATVEVSDAPPQISTQALAADCGEDGSIEVQIQGSGASFEINWTGPVSGSATTSEDSYLISGLPSGDYEVILADQSGCTDTDQVNVEEGFPAVDFTAQAFPGACGEAGTLGLTINSGELPYNINWTGPVSGSENTPNDTYMIMDLPSGIYTITVTDRNGCTEQSGVEIENGSNQLNFNAAGNPGFCGQPGSITVEILAGQPEFSISWTGPLPGFATTNANTFEIENLPNGTYVIQVTDASGCNSVTSATVLNSEDELELFLNPLSGLCGELGAINLLIEQGTPTYKISWTGPVSGTTESGSDTYQITDLPAGTYTIEVIDANDCTDTQTVQVESSPDLEFTAVPIDGNCEQEGFIIVDIAGTDQNYTITWTGPVSGQATSQTSLFNIPDLPSGVYSVEVEDQNGCDATEIAEIQNFESDLAISAQVFNGACGELGFIQVNIAGGDADYELSWSGPESGSVSISSNSYVIPDLISGNYQVMVIDNNACQSNTNAILSNGQGNFDISTQATGEDCDQPGFIALQINQGLPPFQITWDGPENGSEIVEEFNYSILNLPAGSYTLNLLDANNCEVIEVIEVELINENPSAGFEEETDILSVIFDNNSSQGSYFWDFGDGTTSTEVNPTHTYCEEGTFTVCLTVENDCGSTQICSDLALSIPDDVVILDVGEQTAMNGETISLPVVMEHNDILVSLSGSLQASEPSVAFIIGLSPGLITPQFMASNLTFSYLDLFGNGISVSEGDTLFYINIIVTGGPGSSSDILIVDEPLSIEVGGLNNGVPVVKPSVSLKGRVTVLGNGTISGQITTFWGEGVKDVNVAFSNLNFNDSDITDIAGNYILPGVPLGESYEIVPDKDINPLNGLSTYALFIGQQFILGMEPQLIYTPYQIIGGNSNCDDNFSTIDLFITQQLLVGQIDDFNSCPSWVFIPQDFEFPADFDATNIFPYPTRDTITPLSSINANFVGVKIGDILGQANPDQLQVEEDERSNETLHLIYNNQSLEAGEEFVIQINSTDFENIVSYQFGLFFDTDKMNFIDFESANETALGTVMAGTSNAAEGELRLSWFSTSGEGVNADAETSLFSLRFQATEAIEEIASYLRLSQAHIKGEAYDIYGIPKEIKLEPAALTDVSEINYKGYRLYQNKPNPFDNQTVIGFDLPESVDAEIIIRNHLGEQIRVYRDHFRKGYNEFILDHLSLSGGIYYYTLKTADFSGTKKMILIPK